MTEYGDLVCAKMSELEKSYPRWNSNHLMHKAFNDIADDFSVKFSTWIPAHILTSVIQSMRDLADDEIVNNTQRHIMASRIKRAFRRAMSDPKYKMCRDRLAKEFECLVN